MHIEKHILALFSDVVCTLTSRHFFSIRFVPSLYNVCEIKKTKMYFDRILGENLFTREASITAIDLSKKVELVQKRD